MDVYIIAFIVVTVLIILGLIFCFAEIMATITTYPGRANKEVEDAVRGVKEWAANPLKTTLLSPKSEHMPIGNPENERYLYMVVPAHMHIPFSEYLWCKYIVYSTNMDYYKVSGRSPLGKYIDKLMKETPPAFSIPKYSKRTADTLNNNKQS